MNSVSYIEHGGEQCYAPPFAARGVDFFGFIVKADRGTLQSKVCDRFLNRPLGKKRFVPLLGRLLVVFNRIAAMNAIDPPDNDKGVYTEQEAAAWVPVLDTDCGKIYWHHPYILVDNAYALAMGREIYGFPKMLGTFEGVVSGPAQPGTMKVSTLVTTKLGVGQPATLATLLQVEQVHSTTATGDRTFADLPELAGAIAKRLGIGESDLPDDQWDRGKLLESLLQVNMPMVFLKQFRDGVNPELACFQAIQTCKTTMTRLHAVRLYGAAYQIQVPQHESHPFCQDLGLPIGMVPVELAFWGLFDFEISRCSIL